MKSFISILFIFQFLSITWAQGPGRASQAPPTSFGSESITGSATTVGGEPSGSATGSSTSGSVSASTTGTPTNTAQLPSLSGYSPCVVNAMQLAVSDVNCSSIVLQDCYCKNSSFPGALISRISEGCPNELGTAEQLAQQFCNPVSTTLSFSITTISGSGPSSGSQSSPPSSTSSSTRPTSSGSGGSNGALSTFGAPGIPFALLAIVFAAVHA